jgi:hypothetical protein
MSDSLYPTRLRWDAHTHCGVARHDRVTVELQRAPSIDGLERAAEIDFIPYVCAMVRSTSSEAMRDMTQDEMHDALALLQAMAWQARDALDNGSTIVVVVEERKR